MGRETVFSREMIVDCRQSKSTRSCPTSTVNSSRRVYIIFSHIHHSPSLQSLLGWPVMSDCMLKVQNSLESTKTVYYRANAKNFCYTHGLVGIYVIYRSKVQICSISTVNSSRRVYILFSHIHHSPSLYMYSLLGWPIMSNCMMKVNDTCAELTSWKALK